MLAILTSLLTVASNQGYFHDEIRALAISLAFFFIASENQVLPVSTLLYTLMILASNILKTFSHIIVILLVVHLLFSIHKNQP